MQSKGQLLLFLWLILGCCLLLSRAVRAFDSEFLETGTEDETPNVASSKTWGDFFGEVRKFLWQLDFVWFLAVVLISVAIVLYRPPEIVGDTADDGVVVEKWKPVPWHMRLLASLTSHAAGIAGFVGFQWIVVARIVSTSQPLDSFSPTNFLLYTSIAISITAIFSSILFLVLDYLRRLVIDSARGRGYRLILEPGQLEQTGLGAALIVLTVVLLFLYMCVILTEIQENQKFRRKEKQEILGVVLEKVYGCGTVLLYFINLRGLCKSPKVFFHQAGLRTEQEIEFKDFLEEFSGGRSEGLVQQVRNVLAWLAERLAGEDLKLFFQLGSRRALFPNQRLAPILHVVAGLLLLGVLPGICQFATERLFVDPKFVDVRAYSATIFPSFNPSHSKYLLLGDPHIHLQVKTTSRHTSSIQLCCFPSQQPCENRSLHHSLIQFDDDPITLAVPASESSECTLTASGLSSHALATLKFEVELQVKYHLCDCSTNDGCGCCDGYAGELEDDGDPMKLPTACQPAPCDIDNSNKAKGWACKCKPEYSGSIYWEGATPKGTCTVAPCEVDNSDKQPGPQCRCLDGYYGNITWRNSSAEGPCLPAPCKALIPNSTGRGTDCKCKSGYAGQISWHGSQPAGSCEPAPCSVLNSNRKPGLDCACLAGFEGKVSWTGTDAEGPCKPIPCKDFIPNSYGLGVGSCECQDGFEATWEDDGTQTLEKDRHEAEVTIEDVNETRTLESCEPAPCDFDWSNRRPGLACDCGPGYFGHVVWRGTRAISYCKPNDCRGRYAIGEGADCRCKDGYTGTARRTGNYGFQVAHCRPAPCDIEGSNFQKGPDCSCADGFSGSVRWFKDESRGVCKPAPCSIQNSNMEPGTRCRCKPGFEGNITWQGPTVSGRCEPVA